MPDKEIFVDTAFIYGVISPRDQWHEKAVEWQHKIETERSPLVTTEFILAEIADGLAAPKFRLEVSKIIHSLQDNPFVYVVPASSELFRKALNLFDNRPDKDWGLTDCASFVVMEELGLTDALTADDHFRQAGFNALLLD